MITPRCVRKVQAWWPGRIRLHALRLLIILLLAGLSWAAESGLRPAGAVAAASARAEVLAQLAEPSRVAIGQNIAHGAGAEDGYRRFFTDAAPRLGGRAPLICGVCYGWDAITPPGVRAANRVLIGHWRRGGLVTVSMSPSNPCTGGPTQSQEGVDYAALADPATEGGRRWRADLATVADGLAELEAAGVPVLWRPLHEMNGGFFWWCSDAQPGGAWTATADYVRLWRDMHRYFTVERGLRNLIWVYAPNARLEPRLQPVARYYPGADVVDVVGLDLYVDRLDATTLNADGGYDQLMALGKPFAITEIGPPRSHTGSFDALNALDAVLRHCPRTAYIVWWQSWPERVVFRWRWRSLAIIDNPRGAELLADPRVLSLAAP